MDIIDRSINMNRHITKNTKLLEKSWNDFIKTTQKRKLILYGLSNILNFLWMRCKNDFSIVAAIDNDIKVQGYALSTFFNDSDLKEAKDIIITSKEILQNFDPNEIVILISSLRYPEEITMSLEKQNFYCCFSILHMEYNYRKNMLENKLPFETQDEYMIRYAKECIQKKIQNNKIIFCGERMGYSDHGKYVTEQLLKLNKNLDIVWFVPNISINIPSTVRILSKRNLKQFIYEMETAKVWIFQDPVPAYLIKRKEQIYIQLKHWGSLTLKKFYFDTMSSKYFGTDETEGNLNSEWMDYIISGSEFDENSCRSGFHFNGQFLRFGSPRSDALFSSEKYKKKVFDYFNLNYDEHIVIYAPTFRFISINDEEPKYACPSIPNFNVLLNAVKQKFGGNWRVFLRLHPSNRVQFKQNNRIDNVIDVSDYDDSEELVVASDIMISDFSSIIFESAYVSKPVFLYVPDKEEYLKNDHELLLDYDALPFPISTTNEELANQIKNFDEDRYKSDVQAFLDKYGVHEDGHASERAAKFIIKLMGSET